MKRITDIIAIVVLIGTLASLCYVFVFLFSEMDGNFVIAMVKGITFAFASVLFVIKVPGRALKVIVIALDVATIIYYYLHEQLAIPVQYASLILAAYSGLIVFYIGRIVSEQLKFDNDTETIRLREEVNRYRIGNEIAQLESERDRYSRRVKESKTESNRAANEIRLNEIENKIYELKKNNNI